MIEIKIDNKYITIRANDEEWLGNIEIKITNTRSKEQVKTNQDKQAQLPGELEKEVLKVLEGYTEEENEEDEEEIPEEPINPEDWEEEEWNEEEWEPFDVKNLY